MNSDRKNENKADTCKKCCHIGLMGIEDPGTGSGSGENVFDKNIESQCPNCHNLLTD